MSESRDRTGGWSRILDGANPFRGDGRFPIPAYSEFMPPPWVGQKPSGAADPTVRDPADDFGFLVNEYQQLHQLRPGLLRIARHLGEVFRAAASGRTGLSRALLHDNPWYPPQLAAHLTQTPTARRLVVLPLALSRTQDDKGRVRWTLLGSSEAGPARPFWMSFYSSPGRERAAAEGIAMLQSLVAAVGLAMPGGAVSDLASGGLRILPMGMDPDFPAWSDEPIPSWAKPLLLGDDAGARALEGVRALLTFRPFSRMPASVQRAAETGKLTLLPFPASLAFFGHPDYRRLARELPEAMQIPLLHVFPGNHAAPDGIRVAQSGWLDEPRPHDQNGPIVKSGPGSTHQRPHQHGPVVSHVRRTHRWNRSHKDEDETLGDVGLDPVTSALFSSDPERLGLYGKPMAKNAQVWTLDRRLLLDGPVHGLDRIDETARAVFAGGHFGYRFYFPPMRAGRHALTWHLPLCATFSEGEPRLVFDVLDEPAPRGYLTATSIDERKDPSFETAVELWPRLLRREPHLLAASLFDHDPGHRRHQTAYNARKLLEMREHLGQALSPSLARCLLTVSRSRTLDEWMAQAEATASDAAKGKVLVGVLRGLVGEEPALPTGDHQLPISLTFEKTATRDFEERYWKLMAHLAGGAFVNKDNADFAGKSAQREAAHDLERLGDHLHLRYRELFEKHKAAGAFVGDHRFRWRTEFDFPWMGGWAKNQLGHTRERNIVCVIPGRDRSQAVIMADHYDTAYMEDVYEPSRGGDLTRRAAAGADDNHSATAALLLAADALLPLSRDGKLARDVWLVHLTGEEFPSDCLGARALAQRLVEGNFAVEVDGVGRVDLSHATVRGAYILDMVAHNNDKDRYVFQISPGEGAASARLATLAHLANQKWNASVPIWNKVNARKAPGPSQRMDDAGERLPPVVAHAALDGEVRPHWHFKSSLYNTDGQILSDAGIPVVLFMENYDINRHGYHDTADTMANIDLDYASAVAAIAIESVAEAATADDV